MSTRGGKKEKRKKKRGKEEERDLDPTPRQGGGVKARSATVIFPHRHFSEKGSILAKYFSAEGKGCFFVYSNSKKHSSHAQELSLGRGLRRSILITSVRFGADS